MCWFFNRYLKSIYTEPFKQEVGAKVEENSKKFKKKKNMVSIGSIILMVMVDKLYEMIPDEVIVKQAVDAVVERNKMVLVPSHLL